MSFPPQNSREEPFVPVISFDHQKQMLLDSGHFNRDGHGLDTRYQTRNDTGNSDDAAKTVVGPTYHIDHPFREEIEEFEYKPWQFDLSGVQAVEVVKSKDVKDEGVWIGNEDDLNKLVRRIADENIHELAIDLEAHSHRTFAGFVCLIQLSIRREGEGSRMNGSTTISSAHDFLIDALSLRHAISTSLGPIFANPNIVKVMHGADSDIPWLQRDFGCYVVNLFDTGRASRALKFPSAGLAYLLRKYTKVESDKSHQLADWRRRPLPNDMREYALSDTRYLLDIYDQLRLELENHSSSDVSIKSVLDRSKDVCLVRYEKEPFRPLGYNFIMDGGKRGRAKGLASYLKGKHSVTSDLSPEQDASLKALYDWRDKTARQEDESVQYVCPNAALLRIASNRPATVSALQRLVNPPPPLVLRRSHEILDILNEIRSGPTLVTVAASLRDIRKPSDVAAVVSKKSTPFDPISLSTPSRSREMLSPILGSEMLYEKAGWKSPLPDGNLSSGDDSNQHFLEVEGANKGYKSSHISSHGLNMFPSTFDSSRFERREMDLDKGQRSAQLIRSELTKFTSNMNKSQVVNGFDVMKYIRPYTSLKEKSDIVLHNEDENTSPNNYEKITDVDSMLIPKSMSEVYALSNANRRRVNKEKSPKSEEHSSKDETNEAEILDGYFAVDNKRQKPNS